MPARRLTEKIVENLTPPKAGQYDRWDRTVPRFGVRVSFTGRKTWMITARLLKGGEWKAPTRITIGRYPMLQLDAARKRAEQWLAVADGGGDPRHLAVVERARLEEASRNTFGTLADEFIKKWVKRPGRRSNPVRQSTINAYTRTLKGDITKAWQERPVASITRREVRDLLDGIAQEAPIGANRTLAYLRPFFAWCAEREIIEAAPTDHMKPPAANRSRNRWLNDAEIPEVWTAFESEGGVFGPLFKLMLLTGQRRGEVAGMQRDELKGLDGDAPIWELPGERTKNHQPHAVPLSPQAVAIIKKAPKMDRSPYVFTTTGETPVSGFGKIKERIDAAVAKARTEAGIKEPMRPWTLHDLRHSVSTGLRNVGVLPHVVEVTLNHISGHRAGVAGVYDHADYLPEKRAALVKWADHIDDLLAAAKIRRAA